MRVEVSRKKLLEATKKLLKTADCRGNIPVLSHVLVEVEGNTLRLTTSNLEQTGWVEIKLKEQLPSTAFLLPIKKLEKIVSKSKGKIIAFEPTEAEDGGTTIKVNTGKTEFSIPVSIPVEEFPSVERNYEALLEIDSETFLDITKRLLPFASTDEARYILNCINVEIRKDALYFVASNGHYLGFFQIEWTKPPREEYQFNIHRKVVPLLKPFINGETAEIGIIKGEDTRVVVKSGNNYLSWKVEEGEYPDWRKVIPEDNPNRITFCKKTLLEAINEVSVIFEKEHVPAAKFEILEEKLTISAKVITDNGEEKASSKLRISSNVFREPLIIGFHVENLLTILQAFSKDTIEMSLSEPLQPVLFVCRQEPEFKVVAMPMKV